MTMLNKAYSKFPSAIPLQFPHYVKIMEVLFRPQRRALSIRNIQIMFLDLISDRKWHHYLKQKFSWYQSLKKGYFGMRSPKY